MVGEGTRLIALLGGPTAKKLAATRDLHTVGDLLKFWPRRYYTRTSDLSRLHVGDFVVVVAEVRRATTSQMRQRRGKKLDVVITDGTRDLNLVYFKLHGHVGKLVAGAKGIFAGKVTRYNNQWQMAHAEYELFDDQPRGTQRDLIPIYLQVKGMQPWAVSQSVGIVLDQLDEAADPLPSRRAATPRSPATDRRSARNPHPGHPRTGRGVAPADALRRGVRPADRARAAPGAPGGRGHGVAIASPWRTPGYLR